jgi:hypothetical protein
VIDPGVEVAVKVSMVAPPLLVGAVKETVALVGESAVAVPMVGAPGAVVETEQQVMEALRADGGDVIADPSLLIALTSKVYSVPGLSELKVTDRAAAPETVALFPPGNATTEYEAIAVPAPKLVGGVKLTVADVELGIVTLVIVGASKVVAHLPASVLVAIKVAKY